MNVRDWINTGGHADTPTGSVRQCSVNSMGGRRLAEDGRLRSFNCILSGMDVHLTPQANDTPYRKVRILCRALNEVSMKPAATHYLENEIDHKSVRGEHKGVTSE